MRQRPILAATFAFMLIAGGPAAAAKEMTSENWAVYENARFGFKVTYPAHLFSVLEAPANDDGRRFSSDDGFAEISVSAAFNIESDKTARHYKEQIAASEGYENLTYEKTGPDWFVLSGLRGGSIYYERYILSCEGRVVNLLAIRYPSAQRSTYDPLIPGLAKGFAPGNGIDNPIESCE